MPDPNGIRIFTTLSNTCVTLLIHRVLLQYRAEWPMQDYAAFTLENYGIRMKSATRAMRATPDNI